MQMNRWNGGQTIEDCTPPSPNLEYDLNEHRIKKKVNYSLTLYSVYQYNVPVRISNLIIHEYLDLFYKHEVIPVTEL